MEALNATFVPASEENEVIPAVDIVLERHEFVIDNVDSNGHVQTFLRKLHEIIIIKGESTKKVLTIAEYVVAKTGVSMIIIEDKHSKNIKSASCLGEAQILAEKFAVEDENTRGNNDRKFIRHSHYFHLRRFDDDQGNGLNTGLDLAEPDGRRAVLMSLARIQQLRLQPTSSST
ncbi:11835_t:CDS:2 [Funneliformis caledonium]|uniref:11835_t:CDS:1 n=1 Tax=Funneliformis caledonium TaxID=1117310 RepID=A0A9N8VP40_9GLOM|nr:11835_t:CDS:2 [Funneliformis caledonium]